MYRYIYRNNLKLGRWNDLWSITRISPSVNTSLSRVLCIVIDRLQHLTSSSDRRRVHEPAVGRRLRILKYMVRKPCAGYADLYSLKRLYSPTLVFRILLRWWHRWKIWVQFARRILGRESNSPGGTRTCNCPGENQDRTRLHTEKVKNKRKTIK